MEAEHEAFRTSKRIPSGVLVGSGTSFRWLVTRAMGSGRTSEQRDRRTIGFRLSFRWGRVATF